VLQVNKDVECNLHIDGNNLGPIIGIGDYKPKPQPTTISERYGGQLWTLPEDIKDIDKIWGGSWGLPNTPV
jgi:hypothetical protein